MNGYKVEIIQTNIDDKLEKVKIKNFNDAVTLTEGMVFEAVKYASLHVINEYSKNDKEYDKYIFVDEEGNMYITGSNSIWDSYSSVMEEFDDGEIITFEVKSKASSNNSGKFLYLVAVSVR